MIGLDFETYSAADLRSVGLYNYMDHETFRPLLAAVAFDDYSMVLDLAQGQGPDTLLKLLGEHTIVAHNAGFEQMVLRKMGIDLPSWRFIDSAVLARACGYGSSLEAAAPQILGTDKMSEGKDLIRLFSMPQSEYLFFDPHVIEANLAKWNEFKKYCELDAVLSLAIARHMLGNVPAMEMRYAAITMDMNATGWRVDLDSVHRMRELAHRNTELAKLSFAEAHDAHDLNLASHKQLVQWCIDHGVRATSFDEKHVRKLIAKLEKRSDVMGMEEKYAPVLAMLRTKQEIGGSSLKKLDTIISQTGSDGRLHDQYLHVGAGATCRTTGRGVQMQNLKRLAGEGDNMLELEDPDAEWDNGKLAANLRQVFTAQHPDGMLIVGDFSSVESRGLAWQADEEWKLHAYVKGHDLYKVQAGRIYGKDPGAVTKQERQIGKVAELACGYGAGGSAVQAFAENMGTELGERESVELVKAWRTANPEIVKYWYELDDALRSCIGKGVGTMVVRPNMTVYLIPFPAPKSLAQQVGNPDLLSLRFEMHSGGETVLTRYVHGVKVEGRNVRYWKPSDRKTGDLWSDRYTDPKTGLTRMYSLYGGKLTGLLTQSLCRELFFTTLSDVYDWVNLEDGLQLVGQFHDEIVLEWRPMKQGGVSLEEAMSRLEKLMSSSSLHGFPLAAQVKADYRYTK